MSASHFLAIEILRVPHVYTVECPGKRGALMRNRHEMHVVVHQAKGKYLSVIAVTELLNERQIFDSIVIAFKDILPVVASLCNVVSNTGCNYSS